MALTLDRVTFCYSPASGVDAPALTDVSFEVAAGELVLVLGATGSGKSTLLRTAAGLLEPSSGTASIDGARLGRTTARGVVGLVFQDAEKQLFAESLLEDVAFGPKNLGAAPDAAYAAAREALDRVGLAHGDFGPRSPFALSGGEARRAAIAGVLAMSPRYMLMDEPTAGLDARGRHAVRDVVREARASGGVVVVSHSAQEFLGEADRVLLLREGHVAFCGDAEELVARPEWFARAGLAAPDVLRVQQLAIERGLDVGVPSLDPELAAQALVRAGGWR